MSVHDLTFELNGVRRTVRVPAERLLVDLLRYDCGLTGTKEGCGIGVCGACSVLVDGAVQSACLLPAVLVDGASIRTVEGLADDGALTPLQQAFIRKGGFQCGICTPGQLVSATALLREHPDASEDEIRAWMMGNLCRCTGYYQIVEAIRDAQSSMSG
jgi:carbon-monoxide dehydrogenase small subunit